MKKLVAFLLTLVLAVAIFGCGSKDKEVLPTGLKLQLASTVAVDETITGTVKFTPADTTNQSVKWESSDTKVATVKNGKVTGVSEGKATITVTSEAASNVKDSVEVTVTAAQETKELTGLSFSVTEAKVAPEQSINLKDKLVFEPAGATDEIIWSSDHPEFATVLDGIVSGIAEGNVVIKATAKSNSEIYAELNVAVDPTAAVKYVEKLAILTQGVTSLYVAETARFSLSFNDSIAENAPTSRAVKWESSDEAVATVSEGGTITGVAEGTVKIKAIALGVEPGKEGTIFAEITLEIKGIVAPTSFDAKAVSEKIIPGTGTSIVITVEPENGDKRATFESDNEAIATVDEFGNVKTTNDSNGTVNIKVTSTADPTKVVIVTITVANLDEQKEPESITIKGEKTVYIGDAYSIQLTAVVLPATAPQEVVWSTNNDAIATVDQKGNVTGIAEGTARIRATSKDYPEIKSQFWAIQVKVKEVVEIPDLKGYEIVFMNADSALGDIDPFLESYKQLDKSYKQEAWREVEKNFNCKITVKAYPPEAPWGDTRVNWLIENANNKTSQCDLGTISTNWLYRFAEENGNAAVDVTSFYDKYGDFQMTQILKECGSFNQKIYVASTGTNPAALNVDFGLYYNLALIESLNLDNPAKMFNEGNWTYTNFKDWVKKAGAAMGEGKFALAGHPYYWWFGLTNAAGIKVADTTAVQVNLLTQRQKDAAAMYWELYEAGYIDTVGSWCEAASDGNAWFKGEAVMTTGYFWFVKQDNRWYCDDSKKIWGEDTRFGYVPFPYPDDMPKEQTRISNSGLSAYLYVKGRQYPAGVTTEGVYQAVNEMFLQTIRKQKADPLFNANVVLETSIKKRIDDPESVEAMKFFDATKVFFDPAHGIYTSTAATPLKTPCVNVMMKGADYEEEFKAVYSSYETDFKKIYG